MKNTKIWTEAGDKLGVTGEELQIAVNEKFNSLDLEPQLSERGKVIVTEILGKVNVILTSGDGSYKKGVANNKVNVNGENVNSFEFVDRERGYAASNRPGSGNNTTWIDSDGIIYSNPGTGYVEGGASIEK